MAGHSKFKNIMHRKGAQDARRAKLFSKLGREIQVAAREGGGDPAMNARLRLALQNARGQNMPRERIEKAVQAGIGGATGEDYEAMRYEGYGPGGVAILVEALTNNRNRTAGDVRAVFTKNEGNLGAANSVGFMFDRLGEIVYPAAVASADTMFEAVLETGASGVESGGETHDIVTAPEDFGPVRAALAAKFGEPEKSGLTWRANVAAPADEGTARTVMEMIEALEDNDDVQAVYTNLEVAEAVMQKIANG